MRKFLELTNTEGHIILINVDRIAYITVNDYKETIIELIDDSFITVSQTYAEIRKIIRDINL